MVSKNSENEYEESTGQINYKRNFRVYLNLARPYKWLFVVITLIVLANTVGEAIERYIFKFLIDNGTAFSAGALDPQIFTSLVILSSFIYLAVVIFTTLANWARLHFVNSLELRLILDLKKKFFNHIIGLSHSFHSTHRTGSLITRLTRGSKAIESITDFLIFHSIPLIIEIVVIGVSVFYFDALSTVVLLGVSGIFAGYSIFMLERNKILSVRANDAEDIEKGHIADTFMNIEAVKYFGKEDMMKGIFASLAGNTRKKYTRSWNMNKWLEAGQAMIISIGGFFMLFIPFMRFYSGDISLGTLAFIFTSYLNIVGPLFVFVWGVRHFYESMADFQALFDYGELSNDIKDVKGAKALRIRTGKISFENVLFSYKNRKVINGINLSIKPHEKVAIVGHSGSGKTTLIKLLYRLYDLNEGKIFIDGKDISKIQQESLRSELSVVPQECILFNDTIYKNIAFSRPNATKKDIAKAIKIAQLSEFISRLPLKEKTMVGERGIKLSGGEKQRLSIARAILANKKVLVLDEATSALDSKTEQAIQQALAKLMKGRTTIIIAHRLSTIMSADKIVVMEKGKITQVGSHNDLISKQGTYKELWNLQKGGYLKE